MMTRAFMWLIVALSLPLVISSSVAQTVSKGDELSFVSKLNARFPATRGASVAPAFEGFHSIALNGQVVFVRDDLSIIITGNVVDLATNRSLSAAVRAENPRKADVSKLDINDAIQIGRGSHRIYVFSDPDCPYCRSLQAELAKLHDVAVFIFPFPLAGLHPGARQAAENIWCHSDRVAAWNGYVLNRVPVPQVSCATPIDRNLAIGTQMGIRATPTLILPDGRMVEGLEQADRIEAQVAEGAK